MTHINVKVNINIALNASIYLRYTYFDFSIEINENLTIHIFLFITQISTDIDCALVFFFARDAKMLAELFMKEFTGNNPVEKS